MKKNGEKPNLLHFLGQINDDPEYYQKSWDVSKERSVCICYACAV
jgi:hypothetical protein